jgi:nucleotide-binding universal stress UspA family protein
MTQVGVPVRCPLTQHSRATLAEGIRVADERDADLSIRHVNLYQERRGITRRQLKSAVQDAFGHLPRTRYVVRSGLLVEETILEEIAAQKADVVVIGKNRRAGGAR